jgi:hypothetical protein
MIYRFPTLVAVTVSLGGCASVGQTYESELASCAASAGDRSVRANVEFVNRSGAVQSLAWITPAGSVQHYRDLAPGESHVQSTYVGHLWMVRSASGGPSSMHCVQVAADQRIIEQ